MIIGLVGELGSGKTTYVQQKAKELGIKEAVLSPTFVILKRYALPTRTTDVVQSGGHDSRYTSLIHMDVYRLSEQEFKNLDIDDMLNDPQNLVYIEWADKVKNCLPKNTTWIEFKHEK